MQNENWFDDLTESQFRYKILFALLAIGIDVFIFRKNIVKEFNWLEQNKEWQKEELKEMYFGIVVSKRGDYRNSTFVVLNNSSKMPADDYWYTVEFENGKSAKGNFSLKR